MASFLLDHNVKAQVQGLLRGRGHECAVALERGLDRASDDLLLLNAADTSAILVTHNKQDFRLLHRAWHSWSAA